MAIEELLKAIGLLEFLACDPRPTLILDTTIAISHAQSLTPVHCNPALVVARSGKLLDALIGKISLDILGEPLAGFSNFRSWAINVQDATRESRYDELFVFCGFTWIKIIVEGRWTVISGTSNGMVFDGLTPSRNAEVQHSIPVRAYSRSSDSGSVLDAGEQQNSYDWTSTLSPSNTTPHIEFARSIDWGRTPLGPMSKWSTQLRSSVNIVMQDPRPAVVFWGPEVVMIYNEPYTKLIGELHPACMGLSARIALSEVWDHFEPIIERNIAGESVEEVDTPLLIDRSGFLEETYFSLKFIPVLDSVGATVGFYETVIESVSSLHHLMGLYDASRHRNEHPYIICTIMPFLNAAISKIKSVLSPQLRFSHNVHSASVMHYWIFGT
jgi:hypothetical protein